MRKSHLSKDQFRDYALQHFVIVEFDDPQRKAKPANYPTRLKLEGPWAINACPITVLADARGRRYAELRGAFFQPTADYLKWLDKQRQARLTRDESLLTAARSQGLERAKWLDQALGAMSEDVLPSYADEVREILKLDPADRGGFRSKYLIQEARVRLNEAGQLAQEKDWSGVLRLLDEEFEKLQPMGDVAREGFVLRGLANASLNRLEPAVADYQRFLIDPDVSLLFRYQYAMLLLATGRLGEYRAAVERLHDRFGREQNPSQILPVLQAARLADGAVADYEPLVQIAAKLVEANNDKFPFVRTHGHLLYRAGRYREAVNRLEEAFALGKQTHPFLILDGFFLAMAHHRLGHAEAARDRLARTEQAMDKLMADPKVDAIFAAVKAQNNWANRLVAELVRAEAEALIRGAPESKEPAAEVALARAHDRLGQWEQAARAYDRAIERQPADPHLRLERAECRLALHRDNQAALDLARAIELAPGDTRLLRERGRIYADWGRWEEAAADFARAIAGVSDSPAQAALRTPSYEELLRWDPVFTRVAELRPEDHGPRVTRGDARARRADWKGAAADFAKAIALRPEKHPLWYQQTTLLLASGDEAGYRRHCREMLDRYGATDDPVIAERTAKSCLLLPCGTEQLHAAASLAETALAKGAGHKDFPFFSLAKGLVEYREGHFAAAEQRLGKLVADRNPDWNLAPPAYLILAMAQHRLGQAAKAGESLNRAVKIMDQQVPDLANAGESWHDWLINRIFRSEAEALILYDPIFPADPFAP
jgi:tetratricopeptide (TPR) repeat protein